MRATSPKSRRARAPIVPPSAEGLCNTCLNAPECTFPRSADRPVRSCDEHVEDEPFFAVASVSAAWGARLPMASSEPATADSGLRGLCRTCDHHPTCEYPRPVGGVWHCDEFE